MRQVQLQAEIQSQIYIYCPIRGQHFLPVLTVAARELGSDAEAGVPDVHLDHVGGQLLDPDLNDDLCLRLVPVMGDPANQSQVSIQVTLCLLTNHS